MNKNRKKIYDQNKQKTGNRRKSKKRERSERNFPFLSSYFFFDFFLFPFSFLFLCFSVVSFRLSLFCCFSLFRLLFTWGTSNFIESFKHSLSGRMNFSFIFSCYCSFCSRTCCSISTWALFCLKKKELEKGPFLFFSELKNFLQSLFSLYYFFVLSLFLFSTLLKNFVFFF